MATGALLAVGILHLDLADGRRARRDQYARLGAWAAGEGLALVEVVQLTGRPVPDDAARARLAAVVNEALGCGARVVLVTNRAFDPGVVDPTWGWPDVMTRVMGHPPGRASSVPRQQQLGEP